MVNDTILTFGLRDIQ